MRNNETQGTRDSQKPNEVRSDESEVEGTDEKKRKRKRKKERNSKPGIGDQKPETPFYPFTLIFENDSTARLGVGRPIDSAGRNVVKISIRFTCGSTSFDSSVSERIW